MKIQMECIKSLQSATARLQKKISSVESVTSEREQEVAASLQDIANCVSEAKSERGQLHDLLNNRSFYFNVFMVLEYSNFLWSCVVK